MNITVRGSWMTGSDDSLIDFEPTGNGDLGPWIVEDNWLFAGSPAGHGNPAIVASFFGNGNVPDLNLRRSSFSRNKLFGGRVYAGKLSQCRIDDNWFFEDYDTGTGSAAISITEVGDDISVSGNFIETSSVYGPDHAIHLSGTDTYDSNGVHVHNNVIKSGLSGWKERKNGLRVVFSFETAHPQTNRRLSANRQIGGMQNGRLHSGH